VILVDTGPGKYRSALPEGFDEMMRLFRKQSPRTLRAVANEVLRCFKEALGPRVSDLTGQ
jgi:hypothetical protein